MPKFLRAVRLDDSDDHLGRPTTRFCINPAIRRPAP